MMLYFVLESPPPWKDIVEGYTQNTTFHGVRYITLAKEYPIRRLVLIEKISKS